MKLIPIVDFLSLKQFPTHLGEPHTDKDVRIERYFKGLKAGVGNTRPNSALIEHDPDYWLWYGVGTNCFRSAMFAFREKINHRLTTEITD